MADSECQLTVSTATSTDGSTYPVLVTIDPPEGTDRTPCDIVCVVDVSGSMSSEASVKGENGVDTGHGLTVLDIVKHSMKTIIQTMNENDRLSLVSYSDKAVLVCDLTIMDAQGRTSTQGQLDTLAAGGMTNLWDGLKMGIETLKKGYQAGRLQHVMLFTDGLPNFSPPRGIIPMIKKMKDKEGGRLPCSVNTFGFGYELDSKLLSELAIEGEGQYSFIPDAGLIGNAFVHAMSNLLVSMCRDLTVTLEPQNGAEFCGKGVLGGHPVSKTADGTVVVSLGSCQYGQPKDVVVQMKIPEGAIASGYLKATMKYRTPNSDDMVSVGAVGSGLNKEGEQEIAEQVCRVAFVDGVRSAMEAAQPTISDKAAGKTGPQIDRALTVVNSVESEIKSSAAKDKEVIQALLEDLSGQVAQAVSRDDWYQKWGIHYLPSLLSAHRLQQCNNFKDAGVQVYGSGELFGKIRELAEDIFTRLPPPQASPRPPAASGGSAYRAPTTAHTAAPVAMSAYYDRYAGCIDGASMVHMQGGRICLVKELRKGDVVESAFGGTSEVECIVRTAAQAEKYLLVEMSSGLKITPYHPVWMDGEWSFPGDHANAYESPCDAVYSILLKDQGHSLVVGGIPCVALGHGLEEGAAKHAFLGSHHRVAKDLSKFAGFQSGLVDLKLECILRDPDTGLICGFSPYQ